MSIVVNIFRFILAITFILSGFVKAIDPIGTQIKLQDYLDAIGLLQMAPDMLTLGVAVALSTLEFLLGMLMLFAIHRRLTTRVMVIFMTVMTAITVWIFLANPVSDCGCFGDAIHLTNGQTFLKNVILLVMAIVVAAKPLLMPRFVKMNSQAIVLNYTLFFIIALSAWCLYDLPVFDFRPYSVGTNIIKGMEIPEGAELPEFETTFILEKDGVQKEFTLNDYPDSTWTFIDSKTVQTKEGYVPSIHDFSLTLVSNGTEDFSSEYAPGDDITDDVLAFEGYTFLLVSPHLEQADDSNFGNIDMLYEYATEKGCKFYCLTASGDSAIAHWSDITGAEYAFTHTDETTLKTIIRSNPGLLLLHNGTIIGKWSHNRLPVKKLLTAKVEPSQLSQEQTDDPLRKLMQIALWFALPLLLLVISDKHWFWSRMFHRPKTKEEGISQFPVAPETDTENIENKTEITPK